MKSHLRIGGKIGQPVAPQPVRHIDCVDLPEALHGLPSLAMCYHNGNVRLLWHLLLQLLIFLFCSTNVVTNRSCL